MVYTGECYIDGMWVSPAEAGRHIHIVNPATEEIVGEVALGSSVDVDKAVAAARAAFEERPLTIAERVDMLNEIASVLERRKEDAAQAMTMEMGSPISFSRQVQVPIALAQFRDAAEILKKYRNEQSLGSSRIVREPIGVCGFITPWNWPLLQISSKLAAGLAAGCAVIWKPSEVAPLSALVLADVLHQASVPRGFFNMINGDGPSVGAAIAAHPGIDMVSVTGSTRTGIAVAKGAADTIKRVHQELGGKSAHIIFPDADLKAAVVANLQRCFRNSGQSCQAPTRMLVHESQLDQVLSIVRSETAMFNVGDPANPESQIGPVVNATQFEKIQNLIECGIKEGASVVCGGQGRPKNLSRGYYVQPTVFANVTNDMTLAREEIFGPVLVILTYHSEEEAVSIANDSIYGLAAYVSSSSVDRARRAAYRLRAGRVYINMAAEGPGVPFGGYKQSGNGRETGVFGLEEFMEIKAIIGDAA